jgi:hypothetical protein
MLTKHKLENDNVFIGPDFRLLFFTGKKACGYLEKFSINNDLFGKGDEISRHDGNLSKQN